MSLNARPMKWMYALVGALIALLLGLAALQYHWLGEVSEGERERMQSNLNTSIKQFGTDFDREMTRIFLAFQTDVPAAAPPADIYAERYRNWRVNAPYPRLVREVYLLEQTEADDWRLACYQPDRGTFAECAWPQELGPLQQRLASPPEIPQEVQQILKQNGRGEILRLTSLLPLGHGMVEPDIPALIVPTSSLTSAPPGLPPSPLEVGRKCFVVALDKNYLTQEFLPSLAQKYAFGGPASEYRLTVLAARDPGRVVYQSDAGVAPAAGDADTGLFSIHFDEFDKLLLRTATNTDAAPTPKSGQRVTINVYQRSAQLKSTANPPVFAARLGDEAAWRAVVQHRAGSLDAAVARARRRNLLVSAAVLALLSVSLGLIVRASRRAQMLAAQQMEFVAGVSHELRTPLAVICSAGENLADGVVERQAQIQRYGALIRDEGRRLGEMVEQVLEFAGAQSGRRVYDLRPVSAHAITAAALAPHRKQLEEEAWEWAADVPETLPPVLADAPALTRAVQNLIGNALKYSNGTRWLNVSAHAADGFVALEVRDRGRGIAPEELAHIFEPFQRGREAVAEQIHGNGLGLSLVKHIATAHGGRVEVESRPGQGSAFTLYIPAALPEQDALPA